MSTYQILGSGSFGAVVAPALPNVDASGNPIAFGPQMVTKVMFHKRDYDKALQDAADIQAKIPAMAIATTPYRYKYNIRDVADGIPGMRRYITKHQSGYSGAYLVRMPNLGYSFADIQKDSQLQAQLRQIPVETICRQILKLMRVVKYVGDAGYIHGDIRETNVMCNTLTGDMTIIDFDWLLKKSVYNKTYPSYFYSHPPEEMYFLNGGVKLKQYIQAYPNRVQCLQFVYGDIMNQLSANPPFNTFWKDNYWKRTIPQHKGINDPEEMFAYELTRTITILHDRVYDQQNPQSFDEVFREWNGKSMDSVDTFGLAVALEGPLRAAFNGPSHKLLMDFLLNKLFYGMKAVWLYDRITIDKAISMFEAFLRVNYPNIELGEQPDFGDEMARLAAIEPADVEHSTAKKHQKHRTVNKHLTAYAALVRALTGMSLEKSPLPNLPPSRSAHSRSTRSHSSPNVVGGKRSQTRRRRRISGK
jgi:hypothetical protein